MPKSSSQRRREKQQAAEDENASLRAKVATLEQQARAVKPPRHGRLAARTPASRPSAPRAEPPAEERIPEDEEESEEASTQQQEDNLDGGSEPSDSESGEENGERAQSHSSDGGEDGPEGAIQSGLAEDVLAGVEEQQKSGSADKRRPLPPDVGSTLARILQKHSDADTVPPAWALNILLPAPSSQVNATSVGSTVSSMDAAVRNSGSSQPGLIPAHATSRTPTGSASPIEPVNLAAAFAATTPPARNTTSNL